MLSRFTNSLRARLLLLVLGIVLASSALHVAGAIEQRRGALARATDETLQLARSAATYDHQTIDGARQMLTGLAHTREVQTRAALDCARLFRVIGREENPYDAIAAASPAGHVFASSVREAAGEQVADARWFQRALQTRSMVVSAYHLGQLTGQPTFVCALAARDSLGATRAIVFASMNLDGFARLASRVRMPARATLVLLDGDGTLVTRWPAGAAASPRQVIAPETAASVRERGEMSLHLFDEHGDRRTYGLVALGRPGERSMIVGVGLRERDVLAAAGRELGTSLLMLALIAALVTAFAFHVLRETVLNPLSALARATREVRSGRFTATLAPAGATGEIRELAHAFDDMTTALAHQRQSELLAREAMRTSEARKSAVLGAAFDGIVTFDDAGRVLEFNPAAERLFGVPAAAVLGWPMADLVLPSAAWDAFTRAGREGTFPIQPLETLALRSDLTELPVEVAIAAATSATGERLYTATIRDISDRRRHEETLRALSLTDELTGLYNRRGFLAFARQQLRTARRTGGTVTVLYLDLDAFKPLNDALGHAQGDRALAAFARALRATFREADVLGRLGGDEFAVVATDLGLTPDAPRRMLERLREGLARECASRGLPALGFSSGIVQVPAADARGLDELLVSADHQMYVAKRARKTAPDGARRPDASAPAALALGADRPAGAAARTPAAGDTGRPAHRGPGGASSRRANGARSV